MSSYLISIPKWFVLDPVITVHPDEIFFECFSQDESSYGKLGVNYTGFKNINEFNCGTTNIDYSDDLYDEFQKIRSYKKTFFNVDPSGFEVKTTGKVSTGISGHVHSIPTEASGKRNIAPIVTSKRFEFIISSESKNLMYSPFA